ncbi:betaine/proline/choline family ABC transporter ATP-binding protein [Aminobacterium mobile]|jgi:glycine betaine/proline transport system ATP-binding protein|uniref:betaine/proline/choline family ABC transporter ATP-binding protein n=1 Tax=Aminobacterium mobile TaxID=81467 RepID=UPI00046597B4|nr:betaine/proline/choline family ABC transporter ATP-binding protein [Aminobacterium mobile]
MIQNQNNQNLETVLEIKDLWKVYARNNMNIDVENKDLIAQLDKSEDTIVAIRGVSLSVRRGEVFVIMGLSGSGKSTLIRCILRLIEPTSGKIQANGQEVTALSQKELIEFRRKHVAMVFQHYGLLPHKTILQNVAFGLKLQGIPKEEREERSRSTLNHVGLEGWENYYPQSLSGGMRQRVGIARALVMDAPILLMDEPFSGLDPLIRREMQDELARLQQELHKTIFFVTHDLDEAIQLGDRMAIMKNGTIVQTGRPTHILANPADSYVARFVQDKRHQLERANKESF